MTASTSRSDALQSRLDVLRHWAVAQTRKLWSRMDGDEIRGSWAAIYPAVAEVHTALCVEALDAVDEYMLLTAADAGWRYDVTWMRDRPERPTVTYYGQPSRRAIGKAPVVVLWRIKQGHDQQEALLMGLNHLLRLMGTEAHQIGREVVADRVADDLAGA